jgi:hypothetical protein
MPEHDSKEDEASTVVPSIQEVPWTNHTEDQIRQIQHNNSHRMIHIIWKLPYELYTNMAY